MAILFVCNGFPSDETPLSGIFEWDQAQAIRHEGEEVIYISLDFRSIRRRRRIGLKKFIKDHITIYSLSFPIGAVPSKLFYLVGKVLLLYVYNIILKNEKPIKLIHAHFTDMGAIASIIKLKFGVPLIVTEHSSQVNKPLLSNNIKYLAKIAYNRADRLIAVSHALAHNIKLHFDVAPIVIPNIVNISDIAYKPKIHKSFVFTSIGGLTHIKGFDILIKSFSIFHNNDVKLNIIGDGYLKKDLQNIIIDNNLENQVKLLGYMSRREISDILNQSDVFVLASRSETFGVVYIEAMLAGLPVIGTYCGGPEDFINNDNGLLVPVDDIDALSKALVYVKNNISIYNKKHISETCLQKYSPHCIAKQLLQEYQVFNYEI